MRDVKSGKVGPVEVMAGFKTCWSQGTGKGVVVGL